MPPKGCSPRSGTTRRPEWTASSPRRSWPPSRGNPTTPTRCPIPTSTPRAEVYSKLYRDVLVAQRAALIAELDAGNIEDEAARAMLERLDLQEAGVTARLESRF